MAHNSVSWLCSAGQFSLGVSCIFAVGWQLGLESSEASSGLDIQDGFFTHMSGTSVFFQVASLYPESFQVHPPQPKGNHYPNL